MGRIVVEATTENGMDPNAWRSRLGGLTVYHTVDVETANQAVVDLAGDRLAKVDRVDPKRLSLPLPTSFVSEQAARTTVRTCPLPA